MQYDDCHIPWFENRTLAWRADAALPLHLQSVHPDFRLHSPTVRVGNAASAICAVGGKEPVHTTPQDASARSAATVTLCGYSRTRAGTGGAVVSDRYAPGVARIHEGALGTILG